MVSSLVKASHVYEIFVQKKFKPPTEIAKILDLRKSILLAPAKIHLLWKIILFGPHGCISVALILEDGKNQLVTFGQRSITEATHIGMCFTIH